MIALATIATLATALPLTQIEENSSHSLTSKDTSLDDNTSQTTLSSTQQMTTSATKANISTTHDLTETKKQTTNLTNSIFFNKKSK